jgi:putative YphP/YqiW family bacilliredoxin
MESGKPLAGGSNLYPEIMVIPMREELVRAGIEETRTAEEVDATLAKPGTTLLVVNSICGCAAGKMRPGVRLALANAAQQPDHKITVFAGQDRDATERARSYFEGNPPTSPAIAILRDGKLAYLMQRYVIEQATAQQIAGELIRAFDEFCAKTPA